MNGKSRGVKCKGTQKRASSRRKKIKMLNAGVRGKAQNPLEFLDPPERNRAYGK